MANASTTALYTPGSWVAVGAESGWLLVDIDPSDPIVLQCWSLIRNGAEIDEVLDAVLQRGLRAVSNFALVRLSGTGRRAVVVRGAARAAITAGGADQSVSAEGVSTWRELELPEETSVVRVSAGDGTDADEAPLSPGVTLAASIRLSVGAGQRAGTSSPSAASPLNGDADASGAVAESALPPAPAPPESALSESAAPPEAAARQDLPPVPPPASPPEPSVVPFSAQPLPEPQPPAEPSPPPLAEPMPPVAAESAQPAVDPPGPIPWLDASPIGGGGLPPLPGDAPPAPLPPPPAAVHDLPPIPAPPEAQAPQPEPEPDPDSMSWLAAVKPLQPSTGDLPGSPGAGLLDAPLPGVVVGGRGIGRDGLPAQQEPPSGAPVAPPSPGGQGAPSNGQQPWAPPPREAETADSTVSRASLTEMVGQPGPAGSMVQAVRCQHGHLSPPMAVSCRVCGFPLMGQAPITVPRPTLGVLRLSTGDVVPLDRSVIMGRNPRVDDANEAERPHVVRLPSPGHDISRTHVEIRLDGWHVLLTDLNSVNGTIVTPPWQEPQRVRANESVPIEPGTVVSLADEVTFRYEVTG